MSSRRVVARPPQIDTIRAYTFGNYFIAEVDVVLPPDMPLKEAHDIGESLQNKVGWRAHQ